MPQNTETRRVQLGLAGDVAIPAGAFTGLDPDGFADLRSRFLAPFERCNTALINLEAPVCRPLPAREAKTYNIRNDAKTLDLLDNRFVLSLANNHIMDYGLAGLEETIDHLRERRFLFTGAGRNLAEASQPVEFESNGARIAVICAADPRFQPAGPDTPGSNPADVERLASTIRTCARSAEWIILSIHAGIEFVRAPSPYMMDLGRRCLDAGANIVQFHHAHCISGYSNLNGDKLVLWGCGNYAFPYLIPRGFRPWFQSAAWIAELGCDRRISMRTVPVTLDRKGFPSPAGVAESRKTLRLISTCSRRVRKERIMAVWRMISVIRPSYITISLRNYVDMVRMQGWRTLGRFLWITFKTHFLARNRD